MDVSNNVHAAHALLVLQVTEFLSWRQSQFSATWVRHTKQVAVYSQRQKVNMCWAEPAVWWLCMDRLVSHLEAEWGRR